MKSISKHNDEKENLYNYAAIMIKIYEEALNNPELVKGAPHNTVIKRLNAVMAARNPILND